MSTFELNSRLGLNLLNSEDFGDVPKEARFLGPKGGFSDKQINTLYIYLKLTFCWASIVGRPNLTLREKG